MEITLVHAPACHFCEDAQSVLTEIAADHGLALRVVEVDSAEGRDLVQRFRPAMNPLVLLDGEFFSAGRLPRKKLLARLRRAETAEVGA